MTARLELWLWLIATAMSVAAGVLARADLPTQVRQRPGMPASYPTRVQDPSLRLDLRDIVTSDVFRLDREPSKIPFDPTARPEMASVPEQSPPKPALIVRAVVGGPPWEALIDGLPGASGSTRVSPGQRIGELMIATISADVVIVQGMDTTWRLGVARSWR